MSGYVFVEVETRGSAVWRGLAPRVYLRAARMVLYAKYVSACDEKNHS